MFNHGKCVVHEKRGLVATLSPDNAIACVLHGCDVLNKRGFARPYVLSEHTLVIVGWCGNFVKKESGSILRGKGAWWLCHTHFCRNHTPLIK